VGESDYQIKSGDTLWGIASQLKSKGMEGSHWDIIKQIQAANPKITDPNMIYAGDTIKLPGVPGGDQSSFVPGSSAKPPVDINPSGPTTGVENAGEITPGKAPFISQYSPAGAERGYHNGPSNCGPTSMAMIARAAGYGKNMTDAQLINHLGAMGGTTADGTSVNGIAAMAEGIGKSASVKGPSANVQWIADQLKAGKMVVANGDYYAMPPHGNEGRTSGHYVSVVGMDNNGNFIVNDPADKNVHTITPAQMAHFINSNPNGGYQISIG
jgi:LysM repeat protein